jgi:glycosyltransferase involved in cell wall biosynthesis
MVQRVLYFSIGTFVLNGPDSGGNIYGRNLVKRLSEDSSIKLFVVNLNSEVNRLGTERFFANLGIDLLFVPINHMNLRPETGSLTDTVALLAKVLYRFPYEMEANNQIHVAQAGNWAINHWQVDHVIVDYLPAVMFWKGLENLSISKTVVTVNREADLYAETLAFGGYPHGTLTGKISHWRLRNFERRMHKKFDKVVAIGASDVPPYLPGHKTAVVTSYLDESSRRWSPKDNRTLFFAGSVGHHPNRLAIRYIVAKLAPKVLSHVPDAKFAIIGASPADVPVEYHHPSIDLMGPSTSTEVERLFTSASLFLCPVENTFGMKFKLAEAAAYGTPFLASKQTMLGFPYLKGLPDIDLENSSGAAVLIAEYLLQPPKLKGLASEIEKRHRAFAASQKDIWSREILPR